MATVMTSLPDTERTIKNLYRRLFCQVGHSCALKIIDLLVLEITEDFVRGGGLAGVYDCGLLFFGKRMQWTSTVMCFLAPGYCVHFAVEQIPTFEKLAESWGKLEFEEYTAKGMVDIKTTRFRAVCHLLECSQFLTSWDLSARANGQGSPLARILGFLSTDISYGGQSGAYTWCVSTVRL